MGRHIKDWWWFYVLIFSLSVVIYAEEKRNLEFREACEQKGGYYHKAYKSDPICLKSEEVIKVIL